MRSLIVALALGLGLAIAPRPAAACSCAPPSIESSYAWSDDVMLVRIRRSTTAGTSLRYGAQVQQTFKGCTATGDTVELVTPRDSATCGVTSLRPGATYLIFGTRSASDDGDPPQISINSCDANMSAFRLGFAERRWLADNAEECVE